MPGSIEKHVCGSKRRPSRVSRLSMLAPLPWTSSPIECPVRWRNRSPKPACRITRRHTRSEEHTSELQSPCNLVCRLLLEKKKKNAKQNHGQLLFYKSALHIS